MKAYRNLSQILTLAPARAKDGRNLKPEDAGILENAAIVFDENEIKWVGRESEFPANYKNVTSFDLTGHVLTPGITDSHTHLLFGGNRAREYAQRLNGVDYQEIAKLGGGILHTMNRTLAASDADLLQLGIQRIERLHSLGVRTVEMKSGYALTLEGELRLMRLAAKLKAHFIGRMTIRSTYMGAHAVPSNFTSSKQFVDEIVLPTLKQAHVEKLVDAVDVFFEQGYFDRADTELIFKTAQALGLAIKIHADEFNDNGGASLAAAHHALSADHLLRISDAGIKSLAQSSTVATLLPGTAFFLGKELPRARAMLDAGCKVAIASDYNPGSSHVDNLLLVASIAAPSLKLNFTELWAAITLNSSAALGLTNQGSLEPERTPSMTLFRTPDLAEITYNWGVSLVVPSP
jgi:imidazolonepropionase